MTTSASSSTALVPYTGGVHQLQPVESQAEAHEEATTLAQMQEITARSLKAQFADHNAFHRPVTRILTHKAISSQLASLSNQALSDLLDKATYFHNGIGGTAGFLEAAGTRIFFKQVALTDRESQAENRGSTANVFNLPSHYQYRVGSAGFGAQRELAAHQMTTGYVLSGECENFPLMYHSRVLPRPTAPTNPDLENLEEYVAYWDGSPAVRERSEAIHNALSKMVIFLEYIPETLHKWFEEQLAQGGDVAKSAIAMVESNLQAATACMNAHDLLHFDAHFRNILTDGERIFLTDFGLATSSHFELSKAEAEFFEQHRDYDRCYTMAHLVDFIVSSFFERDDFEAVLQEYAAGKGERAMDPEIAATITRYAPFSLVMNGFLQKLRNENKSIPYPAEALKKLCTETDL